MTSRHYPASLTTLILFCIWAIRWFLFKFYGNLGCWYRRNYRYYFYKMTASMIQRRVMTSSHDVMPSYKNEEMVVCFQLHLPINQVNKISLNCSIQQVQISKMRFVVLWRDIMNMMSLHEVESSSKCNCDGTSWLSNTNNYINRPIIIFLTHLQANINEMSFVTSYNHASDVMASRYDMTKTMRLLNSATRET